MAAVTVSAEREGRRPWAVAMNGGMEDLRGALQLVRGAIGELAHLGEGLDARCTRRTLGHDKDPDGFDRTVSALRLSAGSSRQCGAGGFDGVEWIGLTALSPGLAVLPVDFYDFNTCSSEEAGHAGPIGPSAFDADFGGLTECTQPGEQGRVAVGVGLERFGAQQTTDLV